MNSLSHPVQIKLVRMVSSNVLVEFLSTHEQKEMNPNEFIRRIEEGKYELVETSPKSRSHAALATVA